MIVELEACHVMAVEFGYEGGGDCTTGSVDSWVGEDLVRMGVYQDLSMGVQKRGNNSKGIIICKIKLAYN